MPTNKKTPTTAQFQAFESAYQYFNQVLFHYELPPVILNLSRKSKAMGFVAPNRWVEARALGKGRHLSGAEGKSEKSLHELSINPEILTLSLIEVYSTLVHEQCHVWQFQCGKPSRVGYHNKEWANKMMEVGLMPSTTGRPGGKITGQSMSDYPIENGVFLKALEAMPEHFKLPFISIEGNRLFSSETGMNAQTRHSNEGTATADGKLIKPKNKVKYSCPSCSTNAWAKPDINIICGDCEVSFES